MAQPPFFHVDHASRDIEALTITVRGPVQDNDGASCIKSGWLSFPEPRPEEDQYKIENDSGSEFGSESEAETETAEKKANQRNMSEDTSGQGSIAMSATAAADKETFPVLLSPGEGVIIHYDLWAAQQHLSAAIYPWTNRETGKSKVTMPRAQNAAYELDIVGGTYFPFVLKEWHSWGFLKLNVKSLVTTSELPFIQPDYSHGHHQRTRPLMWIGVGTETTPPATTGTTTMTTAANKPNSLSLVQLAYRVGGMHQESKPAYWVHKDDGGVEMI
ncbi:hypothetical protein AYO21_04888 [Fonsecaea monophora]|uniref:Uncharacterized protein n=1 Tax=Fonsecaea monophora TaxID=254056 RepID=A0A177FAY1_9EURO|nr:hypothetical protein AYO21_04888 [Fonsecaea monophora]OAG40811.1 hypothetical protein AYO21_04888 [Fonsecaea monophora]